MKRHASQHSITPVATPSFSPTATPISMLSGTSGHLYTASPTPRRYQPRSNSRPALGAADCHEEPATRPSTSASNFSQARYPASTTSGRKSRAASSFWGSEKQQVVCAVSESRGVSPTVGLAFINVTTNEAILSQICDTQFYVKTVHKIQLYEPSTILMVNAAFQQNQRTKLLSIIEQELPDTALEPMDRKYWSEAIGIEHIETLAFREDHEAIKVAIQGNFYATCSFAAVSDACQSSGRQFFSQISGN